MHRFRPLLVLACLAVTLPARAQVGSREERQEGFLSLGNGKDFSGWRFGPGPMPKEPPANWKIENGVMRLLGGVKPHLSSQWDYDDFDLRFEWRVAKETDKTGLFLRAPGYVGNAKRIEMTAKTAGHVLLPGSRAAPELHQPAGQWNSWRVLAVGNKLTLWVNDKKAWDATGLNPARGYIGLQAWTANADFRNLRIREIGFENLSSLERWKVLDGKVEETDGMLTSKTGGWLITQDKGYTNYRVRLESRLPVNDERNDPRLLKLLNPAGMWNYWEIDMIKGKATLKINGTLYFKSQEPAFDRPGHVVVQIPANGAVQNVRVKKLP